MLHCTEGRVSGIFFNPQYYVTMTVFPANAGGAGLSGQPFEFSSQLCDQFLISPWKFHTAARLTLLRHSVCTGLSTALVDKILAAISSAPAAQL
jgi:hypothetical protein